MERRPDLAAARGALAITIVLALLKLVVGATTSSLALLSQAIDSLVDVVAIGLVLVAVRVAGRPADADHHYGHGKAENLVAFAQTVFLGVVVIALSGEAIRRLNTTAVDVDVPWYALALLGVSIVVDIGRIRWLTTVASGSGSEALRAGALNFATDIGTALVALISLFSVRAGIEHADAIGALIVSVAVAWAALRLGRRSVDVLMDRAPEARIRAIELAAARAQGVTETRRVRVRGTGKETFADVTVAAGRTASLERAHDIAERVEREIALAAPGTDVVVHVEPVPETDTLIERVHAAGSRIDGVHEIHNVSVHAFNDRGEYRLHVTLHAKGESGASVEEAHDLADEVETAIRSELGESARVDAHIEPLENTSIGHDVTDERRDIADKLRQLATDEVDLVDCHEVIVTSTTAGLAVVAHVRGRGSLSLTRLHDASERLEQNLIAAHPDVFSVLIHFEPA